MSDASLQQQLDYHKRQVDELAAENLRRDYEITGLRHLIRQKQQGFAILSQLQQSIGAETQSSSIFETTIEAINSVLGMDRTVVLTPTEQEHVYRPTQWVGFRDDAAQVFSSANIAFPPEFSTGEGVLVCNRSSKVTPTVTAIRGTFDLPYFVCVPVLVERTPIGLILSGRLKEARPLYPPLDQGDVDTFQSIAGLISVSVENMRIGVLEEMDRLKTEFFANISHEFRTPITLTLGPLEQLLAGRYGAVTPEVSEQLTVMHRNQERLLELINQILELAKMEAGGPQLRCALMQDVNGFIAEEVDSFREVALRRGIELRFVPDDGLADADLYVDAEKLHRALVNLLSNAFKFTQKGTIEVTSELIARTVRVSVADTGIGIGPDDLPHIFDRFRQADTGNARSFGGTGIGLALVDEIARAHGGRITVNSQRGTGSVFRIVLPLGRAHLSPASIVEPASLDVAPARRPVAEVLAGDAADGDDEIAAENDDAESTFDLGKKTILYADDNADLRAFVRSLLAPHYNVFVARDGLGAVDLLRSRMVDLVLTDLMMPRMSGKELLDAVRADERTRGVPVVLLTARVGRDARIESLDAGADDYVSKPFDEGELLARIRSLLRVKEYQDTISAQAAELAAWNDTLQDRVQQQVEDLERLSKLRRFLSPQIAEAILSSGGDDLLKSHRREITVVFCDLRGFTAFSEVNEPEEVMRVLEEYHAAMGALIFEHGGTLEHFEGDGMMIFFNDPIPVPDPAHRAIRMAVAMRERARELRDLWGRRGHHLDFGVGVTLGYATLGRIGFEGHLDYAAVGSVVNLAARLSSEAAGDQILLSPRVMAELEDCVIAEPIGSLELKGFHDPVPIMNVVALKQP